MASGKTWQAAKAAYGLVSKVRTVMRQNSMIEKQPTPLAGRLPATLLLVALILSCGALCQQNAAQAGSGAPARPAAQPTNAINTDQAIYLVRSALLTLNDANRSGNY